MLNASLIRSYRFHRAQGGGIVGYAAAGALAAARAELEAASRGYVTTWEHDPDTDLGDHEYWCRDAERGKCDGHAGYQAALYDDDGNFLAGLGGVIEPDATYRRVIAAELAMEALDIHVW